MGKNYIDKSKVHAYYRSDFIEKDIKIKSDTDSIYNFGVRVTGENGNRRIYLTSGYNNTEEYTNHFVLSVEDIEKLEALIIEAKTQINEDKKANVLLDDMRNELKRYIENDYIDKIKLIRQDIIYPNGFNKELYIPFLIQPEFSLDIPDDDINLGFNYIEFLHLSMKEDEYQKTLDYIRFDHKEIPIVFVGYDRKEEIRKYIKEAKKDLKNYDPSKRKPPTKEQMDRAMDIMKKMGYKFNT